MSASLVGYEAFRKDLINTRMLHEQFAHDLITEQNAVVDMITEQNAMVANHIDEMGPFFKSKDINQLAQQSIERACADRLSEQYEVLVKDMFPEVLPSSVGCGTGSQISENESDLSCYTLPDLLKQQWRIEDLLEQQSWSAYRRRLRDVRASITQRFFSVQKAISLCRRRLDKPHAQTIKDCLWKYVDDRRTIKRQWNSRIIRQMNISEKTASTIKELIEQRVLLEDQVELLDHVAQTPLMRLGKMGSLKSKVKGELALVKQRIKTSTFSYHHTYKQCKYETKDDTPGTSASVLARIAQELKGATANYGNQCIERNNLYCPEGTAADSRRSFDAVKFAAVYGTIFTFYKPTAMAVAAGFGFMLGGPVMSAAFATGAAIPGPGFIVPAPFAAAAATDWFPRCSCFPSVCEFDDTIGYCTVAASNKSKNPFDKLPYPGQRCVLASALKKACVLKPCTYDDLSTPVEEYKKFGLTGLIGPQRGTQSVNNCLSIIGDPPIPLLSALELPDGTNNTPANRVALYERMKVTFTPSFDSLDELPNNRELRSHGVTAKLLQGEVDDEDYDNAGEVQTTTFTTTTAKSRRRRRSTNETAPVVAIDE